MNNIKDIVKFLSNTQLIQLVIQLKLQSNLLYLDV